MRGHHKSYVIGLDAGTTSIKGILTDPQGVVYASAGEEYMLDMPREDICELDPEIYWDRTRTVIRHLLQQSGVSPSDVMALAFSSQGETLITVDERGRPLQKAIVWLDNRSKKEAEEIKNIFGPEKIHRITGQPEVLPTWPATKIKWLQRHEPSLFGKVYKFLMLPDYLVYRLTGEYVTEPSIVSSTLYFDFQRKKWWQKMLTYLAIDEHRLPHLLPSGTEIGSLTSRAARETGLTTATRVTTGAYDHPAGAIGAGNIEEGIITETTGSAMAMCVTVDRPVTDPDVRLPCQCHVVPNKYFLLPYGQTAGMVLKWFRDHFFDEETRKTKLMGNDPYELMTTWAAKIPPGAGGVVMLPHLMGTGPPEFDAEAKGVFYGLSLQTTRGHLVRAMLEGVACMIKANLDALPSERAHTQDIRVLGGGSKSELWNQIKADMLQIPVVTLKNREAASLGAAILAGTGSHIYKDIREGCEQMVKIDRVYMPDPGKAEIYQNVYRKYQQLYRGCSPLWKKGPDDSKKEIR